jgi:hypothetical protein
MLHFHAEDNRRIGQRLHAKAPIQVAIDHKSVWTSLFQRKISGTLSDISVQGMQLTVDRHIAKGSVLKIWVEVEYQMKTYHLILRGTVMWSKPGPELGTFLTGLQLMDLSSPEMQIWASSTLDEIRDFTH